MSNKVERIIENFFNKKKRPQNRRDNPLPDKEQYGGYYSFAKKLDIGLLDLDAIARDFGYDDLDELQLAYGSFKKQWDEYNTEPDKRKMLIQSIKKNSLNAQDMNDSEIIKIINL